MAGALTILWKDVLLEVRTKDLCVAVLVFSLLVIIIFNFALDPTPQTVGLVVPGVLWVAFTFGGVLGLTRSFGLEKDQGSLYVLMLAPMRWDSIFYGKMLGNFAIMLLVEAIVFPVSVVLFNMSEIALEIAPIAFLATLGIATVGTMFSAMAVNTRAREVMLPILFFPVAVPLLVAAVEATGVVLGGAGLSATGGWLPLLGAIDAIFLLVCPWAFQMILEE